MKIAQKLLISDKATFEQLTPPEQNLWTRFETEDIYRFLTKENSTTVPVYSTRIPVQLDIHSMTPTVGTNVRHSSAAQAPPAPVVPLAPPPVQHIHH